MPTDDTLPDKISEYLAEAFHGLLSAEGPKTLESFEDEALALAARAYGMAVHPSVDYMLVEGELDGRTYIAVAVEPGTAGPYETSAKAEADKKIGLKAGRYIRPARDSRLPNGREEFELLRKFADFHFTPSSTPRPRWTT